MPESYEQPPLGDSGVIEAITGGQPAMRCERPDLLGIGKARAPVEVAGWATSPAGIDAVIVTLDGVSRPASHNLPQPQMAALLGEERAAECGFFLRLDPADCPPGRHELAVVARTGDGRTLAVSGRVDCLPPLVAQPGPGEAYELLPAAAQAPPAPEHVVRHLWAAPLLAGRRVLDAGCGTGRGTAVLAAQAREVVGVDVSPVSIAEARRKHGKMAAFEEADIRELPFGDAEFDAVLCFEAITHVAEPERALDELRRVLRPDGLLLVSAPNRDVYPRGNPLQLSGMTSTELWRSLGERFANVAVYRQQTYHASLLCDEASLERADADAPLAVETVKTAGGPPGSELYAVAIASDATLPRQAPRLALGEELDYAEQRRLLEAWQGRAIEAELRAAELGRQVHTAREAQLTWQRRAVEAERRPLNER